MKLKIQLLVVARAIPLLRPRNGKISVWEEPGHDPSSEAVDHVAEQDECILAGGFDVYTHVRFGEGTHNTEQDCHGHV